MGTVGSDSIGVRDQCEMSLFINHIKVQVNSRSVLTCHVVKEVIIPAPDPLNQTSANAQANICTTNTLFKINFLMFFGSYISKWFFCYYQEYFGCIDKTAW